MIRRILLPVMILLPTAGLFAKPPQPTCTGQPNVCIESLAQLTVPAMRQQHYGSAFELTAPYAATDQQRTIHMRYRSNQLTLYSRLALPTSAPLSTGYPVVVMAPGWISREEAVEWDFGNNRGSLLGTISRSLTAKGFAVVTVGYRGRGTLDGASAEGMAYRDAWGNGSYLSPVFYAIDVLNVIAGLEGLQHLDWANWLPESAPATHFDLTRVSLWGHSQGGDVALTALAIIGDNPRFAQKLFSASIWSGNIPDRFTQADTFAPMASSKQAFMSGDGSWTGTDTGADGSVNPDFIFPWPGDWLNTLDIHSPDWQEDIWTAPTVAEARSIKYDEMYAALNRYAGDITDAGFTMTRDTRGATVIDHDPRVASLMPKIGGYNFAHWIRTPLALHISDRDYYSVPAWNYSLASRINASGGSAKVHEYRGVTHTLGVSKHQWFSEPGTKGAVPRAIERDVHLYSTGSHPD
ncbi:MAG: hypothetical protein ABJK20_10460 [Halieaceae bacterium]